MSTDTCTVGPMCWRPYDSPTCFESPPTWHAERCPTCNGKGVMSITVVSLECVRCPHCKGTGYTSWVTTRAKTDGEK